MDKRNPGKLFQRRPRRLLTTIVLSAIILMAVYGIHSTRLNTPVLFFGYWGVFLLVFFALIFLILFDILAIRANFAIEEREIFRNTLGSEQMKDMLHKLDKELKRIEDEKKDEKK